MKPTTLRNSSLVFLCGVLLATPIWGQQATRNANNISYPSGSPGIYVQDAGNWRALTVATPTKVKAKHGFFSSMTYGAVAAPVVAVYTGEHAAAQVQAKRPMICVYHMITTDAPVLVRLQEKKKTRELDSGHVRATLTGSSHEAKADANIVVPTMTLPSHSEAILLQPNADLAPGEYAVMFGVRNLAIFDFGVSGAP